MIEITPNLFVGGEEDAHVALSTPGWFVISAAKEPFHRYTLGYTERAAPKDHPEYLIARRPLHLILNLVDAADPAYIPAEIINAAIEGIEQNIETSKVLVHCNQGLSRSPTIALLYLRKHDDAYAKLSFAEGVDLFREKLPFYKPGAGMAAYAEEHW